MDIRREFVLPPVDEPFRDEFEPAVLIDSGGLFEDGGVKPPARFPGSPVAEHGAAAVSGPGDSAIAFDRFRGALEPRGAPAPGIAFGVLYGAPVQN